MQQRTCVACFGVKRHVLRCCTWRCMFHHVLTPFTHPLNLDFTLSFTSPSPILFNLFLHSFLHLSLSLQPAAGKLFPCVALWLLWWGPAGACVCKHEYECVCVWVNPSLRGWGGDSRSHKNSHTHTLWPLAPETWTCADMLSVLTGHSERSVHRCNVYTTYVCVYVWERESEREKEG